MKKSILLPVLLLLSFNCFAQSALERKIQESDIGKSLIELFQEVEQEYPVRFHYLPDWINTLKVGREHYAKPLNEVLENLFDNTELAFIEWAPHSIVLVRDPSASLIKESILMKAAIEQKSVQHLQLGKVDANNLKKSVTLRGKVYDGQDASPIPGATLSVSDLTLGVLTDASGSFDISMPPGRHILEVAYVGYQPQVIDLEIFDDATFDVELNDLAKMLDEVVITEKSLSKITTSKVGQVQISMTEVKRTPSFLGMTDIIKQVQTQTGVTTVSEASAGFNVRGGGADQNLVQFDGVPIFNTSHALGFFTAFNAESINRATFYKGGIPAEFGGRISSVLDLNTKEGSYEKWNGSGGIGFISSDFIVGGPIKKDTSSLIFSIRSSYSDWVLNIIKKKYPDISQGSVFFYDASFKYSHKLSTNSKLLISGYTSYDKFKLANDTINQWQNIALALRYDQSLRSDLYFSVGLYTGNYHYKVVEEQPLNAFQLNYGITYPTLKLDFTKEGTPHKLQFGLHSTYYQFKPGTLEPTTNESSIQPTKMPSELALETGLYFNDQYRWRENLTIEAGIRLSVFNQIGPGTVYTYESGEPLEVRNTIDSTTYHSGEIIKTYVGPEPRVSLQYLISKSASVKISYNHLYQYMHLVSNTASVTPVDIWQSSNTYFRPQIADQFSGGYFRNSANEKYEFSIEAYIKTLKNQLDFKDGADLILNNQLETALLVGKGKSYGAELVFNKLTGKFTWGFNYTYSRSLRKIDGASSTEKINKGNWYPANYDQPHIANINWRLALTRKIFFTGFFTYHSGRPVSLPVGTYDVGAIPITDFSERNNYRIPEYHRLDIALIIEGNNKRNKKWEGSWSFSFYNVYGRKNPYSVYFADQGGGVLVPYQLAIIGTMVPSVTYRFRF